MADVTAEEEGRRLLLLLLLLGEGAGMLEVEEGRRGRVAAEEPRALPSRHFRQRIRCRCCC